MENKLTKDDLINGFRSLGLVSGDTVFIRGGLGSVGKMRDLDSVFVKSMIEVVGNDGTIVSLASTKSCFIKRPDPKFPFRLDSPTYAGALPQKMIEFPDSKRSRHPTCSFVAIGKYAEFITSNHGPDSPAYEPIRKIIDLNGKMVLVGCVASSPGFTTAHLVEYDLGLTKRIIFPWLNRCYYEGKDGKVKLFKRKDHGLCSNSFYKFYSHYVTAGIMRTGFVGKAYSIMVPAKEAYNVEKEILKKDPKFSICGDINCLICNARRWDMIHKLPRFSVRWIIKKIKNKIKIKKNL